MDGFSTVPERITVLAHAYELSGQRQTNEPHTRAFRGQTFKRALDASNNEASWTPLGPLLGLSDPAERGTSLTSPTDQVAVATHQKERAILEKSATQASEERPGK